VLILLPLLVLTALSLATPAGAAPANEYGEVTRFGGFDASAFNEGSYGGPLTPGEFVDPMGFAVDSEEENDVYVADRTSSINTKYTTWRIQKLSPSHCALDEVMAGCVLGTTTFTLPNFGVVNVSAEASAVAGLTVDHRAGRLYALIVGSTLRSAELAPFATRHGNKTAARELLAWSTTPRNGVLEAAPGLTPDALGTTGGVVSSQQQLQPQPANPTPSEAERIQSEEKWLWEPQGIAVDRLEAAGVNDNPVAIEASNLHAAVGAQEAVVPGETIVQQVAAQPQLEAGTGTPRSTGDPLARWSAASVAGIVHGAWGPQGISTNPDGTMSVLLEKTDTYTDDAYVVRVNADLGSQQVLDSNATEPSLSDANQGAMWLDEPPFSGSGGREISVVHNAGPEVVQLSAAASSGVDGLYAADFALPGGAVQYGEQYWRLGGEALAYYNTGVRLLQPEVSGAISSLSGETIANTLGNATPGGPCSIRAQEAALAVGADGTLWVLDRGPHSNTPEFTGIGVEAGRQIIELAPGAARRCPQPSGTFSMEPAGGSRQSASESLTVPVGTEVVFHANTLELQHGNPFAYEWDLNGNHTDGPSHDGFETINRVEAANGFRLPTPKAAYSYRQPGTYDVRLKMLGEYGVYECEGTVIVLPSTRRPAAQFTVISPPGGEQVTVDASGSTPGIGTIANYHWSWGDGSSDDESPQSPIATHIYPGPGDYQVKLTVSNSAYQSAESPPQTVFVEASQTTPVTESPDVLEGPLYAIPLPVLPLPTFSPNRDPPRLSPHASFSEGKVRVTLFCPKVKVSCAGTVKVQTANAFTGAKVSGGRGRHRKAKARLLLGQAPFVLPGGGHSTLAVRVAAAGMALLREHRRLPVLVTVAAHDSLGDSASQTVRLTLSAAVAMQRQVRRRRG
jgi:PKD domain-containing protein